MSLLKEFLKRRAENLQKKDMPASLSPANKQAVLPDELFWDIVKRYLNEINKHPDVDKTETLSNILADYDEEIILAFGKRFEELNK